MAQTENGESKDKKKRKTETTPIRSQGYHVVKVSNTVSKKCGPSLIQLLGPGRVHAGLSSVEPSSKNTSVSNEVHSQCKIKIDTGYENRTQESLQMNDLPAQRGEESVTIPIQKAQGLLHEA